MADAQSIKNRLKRMFGHQHFINNKAISQDVASLFIPRRSNIEEEKPVGDIAGWYDHILDPTPIEVARTLSQGQFDLLFTGDWFEAREPFVQEQGEQESRQHRVDSTAKAYSKVGVDMRDVLEGSNFKLEIQEFLADRSTVHTSAILVEAHPEQVVIFHNLDAGTYAIAENHEKRVDTLARKFNLTARQVVQKFDKETDTIPDRVRQAMEANRPDQSFMVQQLIEPRMEEDVVPGSDNPKEMAFASFYVIGTDLVREGGYHEQPFMVSRFDRWGDSPYGTGPAHIELARARSLQKMRQAMLALGDRITNPGLFISEDQEGEINPFGNTIVSREDAAVQLPREWNTNARYDVTLDVIQREHQLMEETFFVPLFKLLLNDTDREKTAFEVQKMLEEQVGRAAPTFARLDSEVIVPLLLRVFNIMLRAKRFSAIEDELTIIDEEGEPGIAQPSINFTSKLAQAMKAVRSNTVIQFLNSLGFVFELRPEILMNTDWNKTYRRMWKDAGNPIDELEDARKVEEQQQAQQEAALAQQAAEAGATAAKAAQAGG